MINLIVFLAIFLPLLTIFLAGARSPAFKRDERDAACAGALLLASFLAFILSNPHWIGTFIAFSVPEGILPKIFFFIFGGMMVIVGFLIILVYFFAGLTFMAFKIRSWVHGVPHRAPHWSQIGIPRSPPTNQRFRQSTVPSAHPSPTSAIVKKLIQAEEVDPDG